MAKLYARYAAMNAGKSSQLLQVVYNYEERGQKALTVKPLIDSRSGDHIESRIGIKKKANLLVGIDSNIFSDIKTILQNIHLDCILVDEAQFLTKLQVRELACVVDKLGIPVIVYFLRTDFKGNLFEGSSEILAIADEIEEIKTICYCGKKATMNLRINECGKVVQDGNQVEIGGNRKYVSVCRKHFIESLD